jgi:hypothetical protein
MQIHSFSSQIRRTPQLAEHIFMGKIETSNMCKILKEFKSTWGVQDFG